MAYLKAIENPKCDKGCGRKATDDLITLHNKRVGVYCPEHAIAALEDLKREELQTLLRRRSIRW